MMSKTRKPTRRFAGVPAAMLMLIAGCGDEPGGTPPADGPTRPGGLRGEPTPSPSDRTLQELLDTPWSELTRADRWRVRYIGGEITEDEYLSGETRDSRPVFKSAASVSLLPGVWNTVRLPGAECANGSEYKIFIHPSTDPQIRASKKVILYFEPGGACWDYASCTGQAGVRGAANLDGVPDNYMSLSAYLDPNQTGGSPSAIISPLLWNASAFGIERNRVVTDRWNKVFLPYCTGDVFSGNQITTYVDPTGAEPDVDIHHVGATNVEAALDVLDDYFTGPDDMLVTGCSAGGAGALTNYHFVREALDPARSSLLNDSGPIFPAPGRGNQFPLHREIANIWNVGYLIGKLQADAPQFNIGADFGLVNEALAELHPTDRLTTTLLEEDYNFSVYSYARFYGLDEDDFFDELVIKKLWEQDIDGMVRQFRAYPNLDFFVPYFRKLNDSHCTTIVNWTGTEVRRTGVEVGDFIDDLLDPHATVASEREGFNFWDFFVTDFPAILVELLF